MTEIKSINQPTPASSNRPPFSLTEILLWLVVVLLLISFALPNFLEIHTHPPESRARSDLRSLATGVEAYCIDDGAYPAWSTGAGSLNGGELPSFTLATKENRLAFLTTPIAYLSSLPLDYCARDEKGQREEVYYHYYCVGECAIIWSVGPDSDSDLTLSVLQDLVDEKQQPPRFSPLIRQLAYDPTNGMKSDGDIIWINHFGHL